MKLKAGLVALILLGGAAFAAASDALRRLYEDPARFNLLSGAGRSILQRRYGPAPSGRLAKGSGPAALPSGVVNDPAADTTAQDTQSTSAMVVGSGSALVVAHNDSAKWVPGVNDHFTGESRSTDGGSTWAHGSALPNSPGGDAGDPVLAGDATSGTVYLSTLDFDTGDTVPVFRSTDGGASFLTSVNGAPGLSGLGDFLDKEWIAVDNFAGTGQGYLYLAVRDFAAGGPGSARDGILFFRSTDGGATWGPDQGVTIAGSGSFNVQGAFVTVGTDHAVYVFWLDQSAGSGTPNIIKMKKSTDLGVTFGAPVSVASLVNVVPNGDLDLAGDFRTNSFPQAAVNPASGNLYVVYNDITATDSANVYFRQSLNGGSTWGAAVRVNNDSGTRAQFHPSLAVTPDGTALFVSFYDRRLDPADRLIDRFGAVAPVSGSTVAFQPNFRITPSGFPVAVNQDLSVAAGYMDDYDVAAASADSTTFYTAWGDNRDADAAHANEPDVFFASVPAAGPGPVLAAASAQVVAESCSPGNGAPDPGETVTVNFTLRNEGSAATTDLVATLEATGGVLQPDGPHSFGAVPPSGGTANASFTFTADGSCGGGLTATLDLQDGSTSLGTAAFTLDLGAPATATFANTGTITITDDSTAAPYPSTITVSAAPVPVTRVTATLSGFSHPSPSDVDVLLVGPQGQTVMLMANVGTTAVTNATLTFDDAAPGPLTDPIATGSFKPTRLPDSNSPCDADDNTWAAPAPPSPYGSALSGFNGQDPTGTWSLYVRDDCALDAGAVSGGWSLTFFGPAQCCGAGCPAISVGPATLPGGSVGLPYSQALNAAGGAGTPAFSLFAGALPPGLTLDPSGLLSGTPTTTGSFSFVALATDANGCTGSLPYTVAIVCGALTVGPGALPDAAVGTPYSQALSGGGGTGPYLFALASGSLPPGIVLNDTGTLGGTPTAGGAFSFAVSVTDVNGCTGSQNYSIGVLSLATVALACGNPAGGDAVTLTGTNFLPGAAVAIAGLPATGVNVVNATQIDAVAPADAPGTVGDVVVTNPDGNAAALSDAYGYDFLDVPASNPFHDFVCAVERHRITAGCGGGDFCPSNSVLRSQMAVFLLRGEHGSTYVPPAASGIFGDVPASNPFAPWIEQLYNEGITGGCSTNPLLYCPGNPVSRAGMAVFLLAAEHGAGYAPPACIGIFADVACPSPFADWIEELYNESITGGCNTNPLQYCPGNSVNRDQMAVFLTATFALP